MGEKLPQTLEKLANYGIRFNINWSNTENIIVYEAPYITGEDKTNYDNGYWICPDESKTLQMYFNSKDLHPELEYDVTDIRISKIKVNRDAYLIFRSDFPEHWLEKLKGQSAKLEDYVSYCENL